MKCPLCETAPDVRNGEPKRDGDNVYWRHIFTCKDEQCANQGKDIGELRTNIFNNSEQQEIYY